MKSQEIFSTETAAGWLPWGVCAPVLALIFIIVSDMATDPVLRRLVRLDAKGLPVDWWGFALFLLISSGSLLLILLLWVQRVEGRSLAAIGFTGAAKLRCFLQGHVIGMASIAGIVAMIWLAGGLERAPSDPSTVLAGGWHTPGALAFMVVLLLCFALQASTEEIFFRGWLLSLLAKKWNLLLAVAFSSAVFALAHFNRGQHWLTTVSIVLYAVFCCAWVWRTRSLLGVMGWHTGWNWLLAVGFGLPVTGFDMDIPPLLVDLKPLGPEWLNGGAQGPEGSVVCVAFLLAGTIFMCLKRVPMSNDSTGPINVSVQ